MGDKKRIKYIEDYVDEMESFFPQLERETLLYIMKRVMRAMSVFMRKGYKIMRVLSKYTLIDDGKRHSIYITRVFYRSYFKYVLAKARTARKYKNKRLNGKRDKQTG